MCFDFARTMAAVEAEVQCPRDKFEEVVRDERSDADANERRGQIKQIYRYVKDRQTCYTIAKQVTSDN